MAAPTDRTMENVERRRLQLEENVAKLSKALQHWSTWEVEYEMLKEEFQSAGNPTASQMVEIGNNLAGTLVTEKEVEELLGKGLQTKRNANQVVNMISRRIDYVQQNRSSVEKQLDVAEKQLAGVSVLLEPGLENEEGLPMMDIEEELDEDENVISSSVSQPGKVAPELMEALRKAGVHKAEQRAPDASKPSDAELSSSSLSSNITATPAVRPDPMPDVLADNIKHNAITAAATSKDKTAVSEAPPRKKSVSFADDTKLETPPEESEARAAAVRDGLKYMNFKPGSRVYELDGDENIVKTHIMPSDEGAEEAELRRQMLQYSLSEVNDAVAELELEELDGEYSDDNEDEYDSEASEEEDEHGRSALPVLTEDYKRQMVELEKKLNARMIENLGPRPDMHPLAEHVDDIRTLRVRKDEDFEAPADAAEGSGTESTTLKKKNVRFANDLDISEAPPVHKPPHSLQPSSRATISDTIVERHAPAPIPPAAPSKPVKVSRFRSSRPPASHPPSMLPTPQVPQPPPIPAGPIGRPLSNTVVEHTALPSEPQAPDEFDPLLVNREIQIQYHKMRNKMIQQQGGFAATTEGEEERLVEQPDDKAKKVSRFKAARLKAEGL